MGLSIARVHREIPGHLRSFLGNVPHGAGRFVLSAPSAAGLRNHRGRSGVLILAVMTRGTLPPGFNEVGAPSTVADDAFAGWVILGPTVAGWRDLDLPTRPVRALRNGTLAGENRGQDALGDPCQALVWLAQDRAIRGTGLKSGDVVITGTRIAPVAIHAGDRVSFEFPDLGKVSAAFD